MKIQKEAMQKFLQTAWTVIGERAPLGGVFAFSACSVHAVAHMLLDAAKHDTPLYWLAAALIELATAWLATRIIERGKEATRSIGSGFAKQDRRFAIGTLILYFILFLPSFITSVAANFMEFDGDWLLAFLFPVLTVACAIGAAMPGIIEGRTRRKKKDKDAQASEDEMKKHDKATQMAEESRRTLAELGRAADVLRALHADPTQTRTEIAQKMEVSPQTVSYHMKKLEDRELIDRSNGQTELLPEAAKILEKA